MWGGGFEIACHLHWPGLSFSLRPDLILIMSHFDYSQYSFKGGAEHRRRVHGAVRGMLLDMLASFDGCRWPVINDNHDFTLTFPIPSPLKTKYRLMV
jgi:hypothetical protein